MRPEAAVLGAISLVAVAPFVLAAGLGAQQRANCALVLEPRDTATVMNRFRQGPGFVTHIGGGMTWRCGNAVMEADSAVKYDLARRVEMMGNVRYRDTIRTLRSRALTYHELRDLVVATGDVLLTRLGSGSTLSGPRVEFLRAVSGVDERTTAIGRPHMTLYTDSAGQAPPFEVDADRAVFFGEERSLAWGDVVIERPDLDARADSAVFDIEGGQGILYGSPVAEGSGFRLSGDTLRLAFEDQALREVRALGSGHAEGESYDVRAERIRVRVEDEQVSAVWAHGEGRSVAVSSDYRLSGDSLRFVLAEGRIDTVLAVGDAMAVEARAGEGAGERTEGMAELGEEAEVGEEAEEAEVGEEGFPAGPDSVWVVDGVPVLDTTTAVDTPADPADRTVPTVLPLAARGGAGSPPLDGETTWMTGDTLHAIFEPAPQQPVTGAGEEAGAEGEDAEDGEDDASPDVSEPAPGEVAESRVERIIVLSETGDARAYYVLRDSLGRPTGSRNYLIGRRIEVLFREGSPQRVLADQAIGVYLDAGGEGEAATTLETDTTGEGGADDPTPGEPEQPSAGEPPEGSGEGGPARAAEDAAPTDTARAPPSPTEEDPGAYDTAIALPERRFSTWSRSNPVERVP